MSNVDDNSVENVALRTLSEGHVRDVVESGYVGPDPEQWGGWVLRSRSSHRAVLVLPTIQDMVGEILWNGLRGRQDEVQGVGMECAFGLIYGVRPVGLATKGHSRQYSEQGDLRGRAEQGQFLFGSTEERVQVGGTLGRCISSSAASRLSRGLVLHAVSGQRVHSQLQVHPGCTIVSRIVQYTFEPSNDRSAPSIYARAGFVTLQHRRPSAYLAWLAKSGLESVVGIAPAGAVKAIAEYLVSDSIEAHLDQSGTSRFRGPNAFTFRNLRTDVSIQRHAMFTGEARSKFTDGAEWDRPIERRLIVQGDDAEVVGFADDNTDVFIEWFERQCAAYLRKHRRPYQIHVLSNWVATPRSLLLAWALEVGFNSSFEQFCETAAWTDGNIWASLSYGL